MHSQDAVLQPRRTKDKNAPLSLPQFLREPVPESQDPVPQSASAIPEFVLQNIPDPITAQRIKKEQEFVRKGRKRSGSAPNLSWLRPKSAGSGLEIKSTSLKKLQRPLTPQAKLDKDLPPRRF